MIRDVNPLTTLRACADMGELFFSAQYQQAPIPLAGNLIKAEWFKDYEVAPTYTYGDTLVISIDTAMKGEQLADFSVATVWLNRGDHCFLLDVWRQRIDYPELRRAVLRLREQHPNATLLIEDKGSGGEPNPGPESEQCSGHWYQPTRRQADARRQDLGK